MVLAQRATKTPIHKPRYSSSRPYRKIYLLDMNSQINHDQRLYQAMQSNDPEEIAQSVINVVNDQLYLRAPAFTSEKTTKLIDERNVAWNLCNQSPSTDNKRNYKNLKHQVKIAIREDKSNQDKIKISNSENS